MAQKFKNQIDAQEGIKITNELYDGSNAAGNSGQVLSSTGTGTQWIDSNSETAERIEVTVKNVSGGSLAKGVVVHAAPTATPPSGNVIEVIAADANDAAKMPAIGVLNETIADEAEGAAVMFGAVSGIDTSSFSIGDELYVSETAGEFTATKPTAFSSQVQKIAVVIKSHASNGLIKVFGAGRANDIPNRVDRDMNFTDDSQLSFGDSSDLKIYHNSTSGNANIENYTGSLYVTNYTDNADIIFRSDDGSGGVAEYFRVDGGSENVISSKPLVVNEIISSYFSRTDNPNSINTNLYLVDSTDMDAEVGGSIVFSGKYKTDGTYLSGGPFIRAYKENANDSNYSFGLKLGIRLNGGSANDTALTIKPNKDVVVSEGDLKVDSSSGDSVIILDNSSQLLRIDQNSIRTTTNSQITLMTNNSNALQLNTSQQAFFYSDVLIPEYLKHSSDEDTYLQFQSDRQTLVAGGTEFIDFANTTQDYITIGGGSDIDIKLVSSTNNKYIFIQGSDGNIGINDLTPSYAFDVNAETNFTTGVRTNGTRYHQGGSATYWYASTTNARINWDARVEGTGVMIHKWNRNADDDAYLSYAENWYDGNSYHKISAYNNGFMLNGNIRFESYGAGNITGTLSRLVGFEANGGLIDVDASTIQLGSGSVGRFPYFDTTNTIANTSLYYENSDKIRHLQTIGPNDDVRKGFCVEDQTAMAANVGGQLTFRYMYTSEGAMTEGAMIRMYKLNSTSADYSSGLKFQVRNTGDDLSSKMTLNPSGFLGLGTTDPGVHLHINSSSGEGWVYVQATGTNAVAGLRTHSSTGSRTNTLYRNITSNLLTLRSGTDDGEIQFIAGGSTAEAMRIGSSQTIGIGVVSPDAGNGGLQVTKTAGTFANSNQKRVASFYDGSVNSERPGIILGYDDSSTPHGIIAARTQSGTSTIPGLQFFTYNGSWGPRMTILANGNVEIPSGSFTVSNGPVSITSSTPLLLTLNSTASNYGGILFKYAGATKGLSYYNSGMMIFGGEAGIPTRLQSNGQYALTILTNLNVGIGDTNPSFKFQVYDTNVNGRAIQGSNVATSGTNYGFQGGAYGVGATKNIGANFTAEGASTNVGLIVNGDNNGALGINNISPDKTLTVGSTSQATSGIDIITSGGKLWEAEQYFSNEGYQGMYYAGTKTIQFRANDISYFNGGPVLLNRTSDVTTQPLQVEGFIDITKVDQSALRIYNGSTFRGGFGMSTWGVGASVALTASDMVCYAIGNLDFVTNGTSSAAVRVTTTGNLILTGGVHAFNGNYGGIAINVPEATKKYVGFYDSGTTNYGGGMWYDEASNIISLYSILAGTETQHVQLDRQTGETWINPGGADVSIGHTDPQAKLDIAPASGDADLLLRTASQTLRFDQNSIRGTTNHNIFIFANNNTANGFALHGAGYVTCGTTSTPTRGEKFYTFGEARFESSVGADMSVRGGLAHYDTTTGNGAGIGGQLVLGYRYSGDSYTEGAIIKMYKVNAVNGQYGSGLKFQVRNHGEDLSAKMTLNGGGDLSVVGSMTAAGDVIAYSDKRVKTNIKTIDNGLEKISKLRGVSYNRTDIDDKSNKIGVIAQEVKEVLPEVVIYNEDDDKYGVEYGKMAGLFIEAIKELKAEVDSLKEQLKNK